jgi:ribonuclease P/MRP protein subunit POP1
MAFWNSLTYTGTRIGGQRERQTQAYEAGIPYFPRDFPFSSAYEEWTVKKASDEEETWLRKPPAKRVNYEKLGVRSPWGADWQVVLGLKEGEPFIQPPKEVKSKGKRKSKKDKGKQKAVEDFTTTQRDEPMDIDEGEIRTETADVDVEITEDIPDVSMCMEIDESILVKPWLFRGFQVTQILGALPQNPGPSLVAEINKLRQARSLELLDSDINADDLLTHALVNVKVTMFKEGVPEDMAMIYRVSDQETTMWEQVVAGNHASITPLQVGFNFLMMVFGV